MKTYKRSLVKLEEWFSKEKEEQKKKGRNLTLLETVHVRRRLGCDGDMSSVEHATASRFNADGTFVSEPSSCTNGPPNLGYPY